MLEIANASGCKFRSSTPLIFPNRSWLILKIHAMKGGLEKYPKLNSFDQVKYCASSIDKAKFPKKNGRCIPKYRIVRIKENKKKNRIKIFFLFFLFKILFK